MAVYEVITPTGEAYEVEGPEGATKAIEESTKGYIK